MSYANGTTHYNLPQTVGSDKRDWFDTNEAFRQIDEAIHTAVTDSGTAIDQIEVVEASVTQVDEKADTIGARVTTIEGKQATDEENIAQNAQAISRVESKVDTMGVDLAEMIEVTEEPSATATVRHDVGTYFRYNDNLWITTVLIRVGDEIVPNVNCETTDVMSRVYALEQGGTGGSVIDDSTTSTETTWSSSKINTQLGTKANKANLTASDGLEFKFATDGTDYGYEDSQGNFVPFKSGGGVQLVGTYTANATVDVSAYGASSADEFLLVPTNGKTSTKDEAASVTGNQFHCTTSGYFNIGSLVLNNNTLTITLPTVSSGAVGAEYSGYVFDISSPASPIECKLYYVGTIS